MPDRAADFAHLVLLLGRLLDADLLSEAEGATLLSEADAARQSLAAGDMEAVRAHVEQIARFTYTISDGHGGSASATVTVTVTK